MTDTFDTFWSDYPRKVGKEYARKCYAKAVKAHGAPTILDGLRRWKQAGLPDKQFIPHASTWLNQARYLDDNDPEVPQTRSDDITRRVVDNRVYTYIDALKIRELRNTRSGIDDHQRRVLAAWGIRC